MVVTKGKRQIKKNTKYADYLVEDSQLRDDQVNSVDRSDEGEYEQDQLSSDEDKYEQTHMNDNPSASDESEILSEQSQDLSGTVGFAGCMSSEVGINQEISRRRRRRIVEPEIEGDIMEISRQFRVGTETKFEVLTADCRTETVSEAYLLANQYQMLCDFVNKRDQSIKKQGKGFFEKAGKDGPVVKAVKTAQTLQQEELSKFMSESESSMHSMSSEDHFPSRRKKRQTKATSKLAAKQVQMHKPAAVKSVKRQEDDELFTNNECTFNTHEPRSVRIISGASFLAKRKPEEVVMCQVTWWPSITDGGATPMPTLVEYETVRKEAPRLLIDYYQKVFELVPRKKK